jgi:hypothetical protein
MGDFLHKNETLSIIELQLNYAIMNEFNSQPKSQTQIGEPKQVPTISEQTILQQPEQLMGNNKVETGHELINPSEMQTATATIEEVREVVQEIPIVEAPQAPVIESMEVDQVSDVTVTETPVIPEKKKMNIFVKAAIIGSAAAGTVLGGLGLSGGFSGKKSEMGKMQEGPKTEQTTSIYDVGKVNPDGSVVTAIANEPSIYNAPKPEKNATKSRMDGAVMPDVPKLGETEVYSEVPSSEGIPEATIESMMKYNPGWTRNQAISEFRKAQGGEEQINYDQAALDRAQLQARAMEQASTAKYQVENISVDQLNSIGSLPDANSEYGGTIDVSNLRGMALSGNKIYFKFEGGKKMLVDENNRYTGEYENTSASEQKTSYYATIENNGQTQIIEGSSLPDSGAIAVEGGSGTTIVRLFTRGDNGDSIFNGSMRI